MTSDEYDDLTERVDVIDATVKELSGIVKEFRAIIDDDHRLAIDDHRLALDDHEHRIGAHRAQIEGHALMLDGHALMLDGHTDQLKILTQIRSDLDRITGAVMKHLHENGVVLRTVSAALDSFKTVVKRVDEWETERALLKAGF